jgi:hypothetical protein
VTAKEDAVTTADATMTTKSSAVFAAETTAPVTTATVLALGRCRRYTHDRGSSKCEHGGTGHQSFHESRRHD